MRQFVVRTGRWGYGSQYGPNSAGIKTSRFCKKQIQSRAEVIRPIIEDLIKEGDIDKAFDVIWEQPWTVERKTQLTEHFIPELVS